MNQNVKILSENNGVTRVTETSGARRGDDLFIESTCLGTSGEIIAVPEFWINDSDSDSAKIYYAD